LPSSVTGSARHMRAKARDALAVVAEMGKTDGFLTLTCNINWPEIVEALAPGTVAFDNPSVVCEVFHERLKAFLHNLRSGKYFDGRKTVYLIHVIEYQERGLPHAHISFRLEDMPDVSMPNYNELLGAWADNEVQASIPKILSVQEIIDKNKKYKRKHISRITGVLETDAQFEIRFDKENETEYEHQAEYIRLVAKHMKHAHSSSLTQVNGCLDKNNVCNKGYSNKPISHHTTFDSKGFPTYRRPLETDKLIVPHNREMLLDWGGHACLEIASSVYLLLYLYKYLYKGTTMVIL
jgi:hypothetical protein